MLLLPGPRMTHRPRVVFFDVMDTLVHDPYREVLPALFDAPLSALVEDFDPDAWDRFERDQIDLAGYARTMFRDRRSVDGAALEAAMRRGYRWLPGMEALCAELVEDGVALFALSNYPRWYLHIEERLALSRFLDWSLVSCRTGLRKPEPATYRNALSAAAVPAAETLFVDDRESNCEAARLLGIPSVRYTGCADLRERLGRGGNG